MIYINHPVTINQKPKKDIQKTVRKEPNKTKKNSKSQEIKRRTKEQRNIKTKHYEQKSNKYIIINNYFKCKQIKCSNKKI